jgi:hypothetical protein
MDWQMRSRFFRMREKICLSDARERDILFIEIFNSISIVVII